MIDVRGRRSIRDEPATEVHERMVPSESSSDESNNDSSFESVTNQRDPGQTLPYEYESYKEEANVSVISAKKFSFVHMTLVVTVVSVIIIAYLLRGNINATVPEPLSKKCTYDVLKKRYPKQNNSLWKSLSVGVEQIINERTQMPAVYLLANSGAQKSEILVKDIAEATARCFGANVELQQMDKSDFLSQDVITDYGLVLEKYKTNIKSGSVVLIPNLNEIPAKVAEALHFICDTHSPIVKNVVIFLTLSLGTKTERHIRGVVDELNSLWGEEIEGDVLDPLITRVTDHVSFLE